MVKELVVACLQVFAAMTDFSVDFDDVIWTANVNTEPNGTVIMNGVCAGIWK
jgi:hypothetical protein